MKDTEIQKEIEQVRRTLESYPNSFVRVHEETAREILLRNMPIGRGFAQLKELGLGIWQITISCDDTESLVVK